MLVCSFMVAYLCAALASFWPVALSEWGEAAAQRHQQLDAAQRAIGGQIHLGLPRAQQPFVGTEQVETRRKPRFQPHPVERDGFCSPSTTSAWRAASARLVSTEESASAASFTAPITALLYCAIATSLPATLAR
jgi:hypothetical protein